MAKLVSYVVSFSPATRFEHGFEVSFDIGSGREVKHEVEAATFGELERQVRSLTADYGQTCSAYIRLKDRKARKPAGFDKFVDTLNIIDFVAAAAPALVEG